jgi:flagellar M-ring protein FliF
VKDASKLVVVVALCLFAFLFVLRPMVKRTLALAPATAGAGNAQMAGPKMPQQLPRTIAEVENDIESQLDAAAAEHLADRRMPVLQRRVVSMAQAEPQNAARLVRSWLAEEKN